MSARKLGLNAVIYGLGGMLNRVIGILLLPLFTNHLSKSDYAVAGKLQMAGTFLAAVFALGVGGSLSSCWFKEGTGEGKRGTVAAATILLGLSCALMLLPVLLFTSGVSGFLLHDDGLNDVLIYYMLNIAFSILVLPFTYSLQFEAKSRLFIGLGAVSTIFTMLCNIVAVAWLGMGLRGWILSQLIGQVFGLVLFAVPFLREKWPPVQGRVLRQLLILGLPMVPSFFFMYVIQQGNRYMVEVFSGWEDLGVYMIGIGLATASSFAVSSFQTSWTPYFMSFRDHPVEAETAFGRATTYYCYFMGLAAVCFFAFAQPVTELMANAKFHDAWLTVGSLALANILAGATNLLTPAQYFSEKLSHLMVMQAIAAAASLGINAGIIWWGGVAYAGFALALSYVFLLLLHGWWNKRGISMRLPIRYEWGRLGAVAAALALVAALTLLFPAHGVIAGFTQGCILVLAFCVLLWLLLTPENRRYLLNLVRRTPAEQKTAS